MEPIGKWSHTKKDPAVHHYFFPVYFKGDSQLYAQLFKHEFSNIIVLKLADAVAIGAEFIESDEEDVKELLDKYKKQTGNTFEQGVIETIFIAYGRYK